MGQVTGEPDCPLFRGLEGKAGSRVCWGQIKGDLGIGGAGEFGEGEFFGGVFL